MSDSPYKTPEANLEISSATNPNLAFQYTKDPRSLTKFVKAMFWVSIVTAVIYFLSDLMQIALLSSNFTQAEANANDTRQGAVGVLYLIVLLITGIAFFKWTYRANVNSRGFGAQGMEFSPGWAVGWYFIPIMNLFKPFQALKEIWQVSKNPSDWSNQNSSAVLGWWWALWIASGILGQITFRLEMHANSVSLLQTATVVSLISDVVSLLTVWLLLVIVTKISNMQEILVKQK